MMIQKRNSGLKCSLVAMLLAFSNSLYCPSMVFNAPGTYILGNSITYGSAGPGDCIFEIASDDVILDLGGNIISEEPLGNDPLNGIVVAPGFTDITIRNGQIQALTGNGIEVGAGCQNITIQNIMTLSCDMRALSCTGTSGELIDGIVITHFGASGCGESPIADFALSFSQCIHLQLDNVRVIQCGFPLHNYSGLMLYDVCSSSFNNVINDSNYALSTNRGFDLTGVVDCKFTGCTTRGGSLLMPNGTSIGFDLQNSCTHVSFNDCLALSQSAPYGTAIGFNLQVGNDSNLLSGCRSSNQIGVSAIGFAFNGTTLSAARNCFAHNANSTSASANVIGFSLVNASDTFIGDCISIDHVSGGTATGYSYINCTDCLGERNVAANVNGSLDSQTYGFYTSSNSRCAFIQNVAARNGSSANSANQFFGFNTFSNTVVDVVTSGPGNISGPWTNIGLI